MPGQRAPTSSTRPSTAVGDFTKIPGLLIRTPDGPLRTAKPRAYENLDELPFMAWDRIDFSKFVGQHYCQSDKQRFAGHH